ncbi:MAG: TonB-dependent receptor [Acidobacteria bacterium]|nr:TonB-dependent receptor [Acidobacteriota bacterium]
MQKRLSLFIFLILMALVGAGSGQTTSGSISGNVVDQQGASVPNATIKITEEGKNYSLTATTDEDGRFVFAIVPPGTYTLTIEAAGFKKHEGKGVSLVANDKLALGVISLEVGAPSEVVNVTSDPTPIQADSGERSFAVEGEVVRNMGVKTRSFINLATLAPGVIAATSDGQTNDIQNISVNGVRQNSNNIQIDGITAVDTGNNGASSNIPLDSIGEFKLLTSTYQAEYGRSSGAQIIAVTRSGTDEFHGSFYYYRQHTGLNANTFSNNRAGLTRPISDQKQIGYTIGGPIYFPKFGDNGFGLWSGKKKLFFFWNQEWAPRTTPNSARNTRVPTALERAGDFSQTRNSSGVLAPYIRDWTTGLPCSSANTTGCFQDGGVLGRIPANRLNALGLKILSIYPMPNYTPSGTQNYNYVTQVSSTAKNRNDTIRLDYNVNENWRVNGRFLYNASTDTNPYTGLFGDSDMIAGNLGIWGLYRETPKYGVSTTVSGSLGPNMMLEVTYGFNKAKYNGTISDTAYTRTSMGLQNLPVLYNDAVVDDILSSFTFGSALGSTPNYRTQRAPQDYSYRTDNIAASLSKVWGNHVSKIGLNYEWGTKNQTNRVDQNAVINFGESVNNTYDTGNGFSNAAIGTFQEFRQATRGTTGIYKYFNFEPYIQDNWKITKKLTLDYGMRFSWLPPTKDTTGLASNFFLSDWRSGQAPRIFLPVCLNNLTTCSGVSLTSNYRAVDPAVLASGVPLTFSNTLLGSFVGRIVPGSGTLANGLSLSDAALVKDRGIHFSPRFGFAYDVTGKQNLIIRGGFAIFYDRAQGNLVYDFNQNLPTTFTSSVFNAVLSDITTNATSYGTPQSVKSIDPNAKTPTTNSYNIGIQYKLPFFDTVLDVSYVGSQSHHLPHNRPLNETPFGSAFLLANQDPTKAIQPTPNGSNALPTDFYRPYKGFAGISYTEFVENSNYNSLQISANRRFSKGLLMSMSYTLSRALGITSGDQGGSRIDGKDYINYGRLSFDRHHNLSINWVYDLPSITKNRFIGLATNGWQFSGIYRYTTGAPRQFTCGVNGVSAVNITGSSSGESNRCILVGDPFGIDAKTEFQQFNINAFQAPAVGNTGLETKRRALQISDPSINNFDLSLSKRFFIWEKLNIEARLDAFNALNHTQGSSINTGGTFTALGSTTLIANNAGSSTNLTGFGAINGWRPNRTLQWMLRFSF